MTAMRTRAPWADRPMRWSQLTLTDNDPANLDVQAWLDYFREIKSDGVCLSAGGYVAYYPTKVPWHYRSRWLGETDPFGALVEGCRALGMVVIARTDPHAVHDDVRQAHPEWIQADSDGSLRPHWVMPGAWLTCMLGDYNFEHMRQIHREIVSTYEVDAVFTNRWKNIGVCYCQNCRELVREACGLDLAELGAPGTPEYQAYLAWQENRYLELVDRWDADIRSVRADARIVPNSGLSRVHGGENVELDIARLISRLDILFADYQGRQANEPLWFAGKCAKMYHAIADGRPVGGIFSVGLEGKHRWKDSVQSPAETETWVAELVAHGMRPWWTKFAATTDDRRWLDTVKDIYQQLATAEPYLRDRRSLARVGVVFSQRTAGHELGGERGQDFDDHLNGVYQALLEDRIPFDLVHERLLTPERLAAYDVVVLPALAMLSDTQCAALDQYVRSGGAVVATHTTSLYDERGRRRSQLGLAGLLGAEVTGDPLGPLRNSYLSLDASPHPVTAGLTGTSRIINGVWRLPVQPIEGLDAVPLRLVDSYPDLPMEEVYVRDPAPGEPQLLLRSVGSGRVAYFPWDIDRAFWEVMHPDHGRILAAAVRWAARREPVVRVDGPGLVDVAAWEQPGSRVVHLVNLSNPMAMHGLLREIHETGPQDVTLQLPPGARLRGATLLVGGSRPELEAEEGWVRIRVPSIRAHEIVAVDVVEP
jgi:hypothetical protein